ncbi:MAG: FtsQ-type POTRA domain-containing protein [Myxococcota bacterium]
MFAAKACVALALLCGGVATYRLLDGYVRSAEYFAITTLEVRGTVRLEDADVCAAAGLTLGANVFEHTAGEVKARLERHPWIARASVERRLPGRFSIELVEHLPVVALATEAGAYLVSDEGDVFKEVEQGDPVDLPVLTGLSPARIREGVLLDVVTLLGEYEASGLDRREAIDEIHTEDDGGVTLLTGGDGMTVRLGRAPYRSKLRRLRQVLERLEGSGARAAYIYMDNVRRRDRVTVRLRELPEAPPAPAPASAT